MKSILFILFFCLTYTGFRDSMESRAASILPKSACEQGKIWNGKKCLSNIEFQDICRSLSKINDRLCRSIVIQRIAEVESVRKVIAESNKKPELKTAFSETLRQSFDSIGKKVYLDTARLAEHLVEHETVAENLCWISNSGIIRCMRISILLSFYNFEMSQRILQEIASIYEDLGFDQENETLISCGEERFSSLDGDSAFTIGASGERRAQIDFANLSGQDFGSLFASKSDLIAQACLAAGTFGSGATGFGTGSFGGVGGPGIGLSGLACMDIDSDADFFAQQMLSLDNILNSCTEPSDHRTPLGPESLMHGDADTTTTTSTTTDADGTTTTTTNTTSSDGTTTTTKTTTTADGTVTTSTSTTAPDGSSKGYSKTTRPDGTTSSVSTSSTDKDGNSTSTDITYDSNGDPVGSQRYDSDASTGRGTTTATYNQPREDGLIMEKIYTDSDGNVTGARKYYRRGYEPPDQIGLWDCMFADDCGGACEEAADAWAEMTKCAGDLNSPLCESYSRKSCECDSFASTLVDPRFVTPNPQGDFVCAGDYDGDAQREACELRCSVADCVESCTESGGEFKQPLGSQLDTYCIYASGSTYDWCTPLSSPTGGPEVGAGGFPEIMLLGKDLRDHRLLNFPH